MLKYNAFYRIYKNNKMESMPLYKTYFKKPDSSLKSLNHIHMMVHIYRFQITSIQQDFVTI